MGFRVVLVAPSWARPYHAVTDSTWFPVTVTLKCSGILLWLCTAGKKTFWLNFPADICFHLLWPGNPITFTCKWLSTRLICTSPKGSTTLWLIRCTVARFSDVHAPNGDQASFLSGVFPMSRCLKCRWSGRYLHRCVPSASAIQSKPLLSKTSCLHCWSG